MEQATLPGKTAGELNGEDPDPQDPHGGGEEHPADAAPSAELLQIEGDDQLTLDVGGLAPTKSSFRVTGGKFGLVRREYPKGSVVRLVLDVRIDEVGVKDSHDAKTSAVLETERRHKGPVVRLVSEEQLA